MDIKRNEVIAIPNPITQCRFDATFTVNRSWKNTNEKNTCKETKINGSCDILICTYIFVL